MLRTFRYLWASPCSLVGLLLAGVILLCGGSARLVAGIVEVYFRTDPSSGRFSIRAITFGHVVLGVDGHTLERVRDHELEHVRQYELWGLFFFLAYPASSAWQWLRGRRPYWENHFEVQARERCVKRTNFSCQPGSPDGPRL